MATERGSGTRAQGIEPLGADLAHPVAACAPARIAEQGPEATAAQRAGQRLATCRGTRPRTTAYAVTAQEVRVLYEHTMTASHALHEAIRLENITHEARPPDQAERYARMLKRAESRLRGAVALLDRAAFAQATTPR